jgi:N-acyl-L-homoserine lactone synthetase
MPLAPLDRRRSVMGKNVADAITIRRIDRADTAQMEAIFRFRYAVYVEDRGFATSCRYPDGLERDGLDVRATHFAAFGPDGALVGTSRLLHGDRADLPVISAVHPSVWQGIPKEDIVEVSRLIVRGRGRGTRGALPGLLSAMTVEAQECRALHWCGLMEAGLERLLRLAGVESICIGPEVDHFGPVRPYMGCVSQTAEAFGV